MGFGARAGVAGCHGASRIEIVGGFWGRQGRTDTEMQGKAGQRGGLTLKTKSQVVVRAEDKRIGGDQIEELGICFWTNESEQYMPSFCSCVIRYTGVLVFN